uniref:GTPase HflX n=1 Tax=Magnetococcus massalia (strain MO-1) TaxID=451514 RepID=A0A1S7LLX4_MAGMO|nr:Putative GTP-binding protein (hflX) [Candidatus Magnetococcus massalia]
MPLHSTEVEPDKAILLQAIEPEQSRDNATRLVQELHHLATTASLDVQDSQLLTLNRVIPATYFGTGQVETLAEQVKAQEVNVVVVNHALSPVQQRNLEKRLNAKVVDRTGLILEIFAARARTREGRMQVELASLMYQQSRLVRSWTHLERQRGGVGLRGGPGERQIEVDRRMIRKRIHRLKEQLKEVARTRELQRKPRKEIPLYTVALVGYTNAGKSTLFNRLAGAEVMAEDKLFATLDPTMRAVNLPGGGQVLLSDTVGFIRHLPHQLVAAFRATLEEVSNADLLLHIVDLSDPEWAEQIKSVDEVLEELGDHQKKTVMVYNKLDQLKGEGLAERLLSKPDSAGISAITGQGLDQLLELLKQKVAEEMVACRVRLCHSEGYWLARFHAEGAVRSSRSDDTHTHLEVELPPNVLGRIRGEVERKQAAVEFDTTELLLNTSQGDVKDKKTH